MKRNYPLFIIDTSRQHGRGVECDYISCTDSTCPFVAMLEILKRGLKEIMIRRKARDVDFSNINDDDVIQFVKTLQEQCYEAIRENDRPDVHRISLAMLTKIRSDYENK